MPAYWISRYSRSTPLGGELDQPVEAPDAVVLVDDEVAGAHLGQEGARRAACGAARHGACVQPKTSASVKTVSAIRRLCQPSAKRPCTTVSEPGSGGSGRSVAGETSTHAVRPKQRLIAEDLGNAPRLRAHDHDALAFEQAACARPARRRAAARHTRSRGEHVRRQRAALRRRIDCPRPRAGRRSAPAAVSASCVPERRPGDERGRRPGGFSPSRSSRVAHLLALLGELLGGLAHARVIVQDQQPVVGQIVQQRGRLVQIGHVEGDVGERLRAAQRLEVALPARPRVGIQPDQARVWQAARRPAARSSPAPRARGDQHGLLRVERALRHRIEGAHRLDLVAEELDAHRALQRRREEVHDAAAMRHLPDILDLDLRLIAQRRSASPAGRAAPSALRRAARAWRRRRSPAA